MAEQDIEIRFRSTREGSGGQDSIDELDDLRERIDKLHTETKELVESTDDLDDSSGRATGKLDDLISIERAQVAAQLAEVVNRLAGALQSMATELESVDPEAADKLNDVGLAVQSLGLGGELAAKGFAVGGPMGAAIGGFIGLATGPLKGAFQEMMDDLKAAKIATDNAAKAEQAYTQLLAQRRDEARRSSLEDMFRRELAEIDAVSAAIERNTRLLETRRQVDAAVAQEQLRETAIRGGDTGTQGIAANVEARLRELTEGIAAANRRAAQAEEKAATLEANATSLANNQADGFTDAEIQQAQQAAEAAQAAAESARGEADLIAQQAVEQIRAVTAETSSAFAEVTVAEGEKIREAGEEAIRETSDLASANVEFFRERLAAAIQQAGEAIDTEQEAAAIKVALEQLRDAAALERAAMLDILRDNLEASQEGLEALRGIGLEMQEFRSMLAAQQEQLRSGR